jgi:type VI secretion system protein ImpJ
VRRTGRTEWTLEPSFIAPVLRVTASQALSAIAAELAETLLARSGILSAGRRHRNSSLAWFSSADVARFWLLYTINSAYPVIRHMSKAPVPPSELFGAMLSLAGSLTAFSVDTTPADLPAYDHANLGRCFGELDRIIRHLLETVIPSNAHSFPLQRRRAFVYGASVDPERYLPNGVRAWLGIRSTAGTRVQDVLRLVPEVVKITSGANIDELYERAIGGVPLTAGAEPEAVPVKSEFQYFHLDTSNEYWERIQRSGDIAVYVPDSIPDPVLELVVVLPDQP